MIGATILAPAIVLSPSEGRDELSSQKFRERGLFNRDSIDGICLSCSPRRFESRKAMTDAIGMNVGPRFTVEKYWLQ
jgi:hypothetical protein